MTELLQQVIAALQKLPADQQDAIASRLLVELRDEQQWAEQFESTTDDQWDRIANMVRQTNDCTVADVAKTIRGDR